MLGLVQQAWSAAVVQERPFTADFTNPPSRAANHVIWGMERISKQIVEDDFDSICARGFRSVILEPGYGMPYPYLSDDYFRMVARIVKAAKKRGLHVWIIDEGKYPSGFAGGKFSKERPDLRMQALVVKQRLTVRAGDTLRLTGLDDHLLSFVAVSSSGRECRHGDLRSHQLTFAAGMDQWSIFLVGHDYRTGQTRSVNNKSHAKTTDDSQMDYLNPLAVRQFLQWTHEGYQKYIGKEFGRTLLGFRGDEPDYSYTPFTPDIVRVFTERKGYDPTPWMATLFSPVQTDEFRRFRADYWDVWSQLFADNFFKAEADWCEQHHMQYITHLNKDHDMTACVVSEGDLFRDLSGVQVPGVDAIWNQIWPDTVNDFPKFASSVSHVFGRQRAFSESFAAYYNTPTISQAKYVVDYQMQRGINFFEFMFWMSGSKTQGWMSQPGMKELNRYVNQSTWLLQQGRPGARIAVYYPVPSLWEGHTSLNREVMTISHQLLQHQHDFDYVTDDMLSRVLRVGSGFLENRSGQRYEVLVIPSTEVMTEAAWLKVKEFRDKGGRVLLWGDAPRMLSGKNFMSQKVLADDLTSWPHEPGSDYTATVATALGSGSIRCRNLDALIPDNRPRKAGEARRPPIDPMLDLRYTERVLPDGRLYFFFNEGRRDIHFQAVVDYPAQAFGIDSLTGQRHQLASHIVRGQTTLELRLKPWQTMFVYLQAGQGVYRADEFGAKGNGQTVNTRPLQQAIDTIAAQGGGTLLVPAGRYLTGALFFPNGVNLRLERDAVLVSTLQDDDFRPVVTRFEGLERMWKPALINFTGCKHFSITGEGTLEGRGVEWGRRDFFPTGRPRLLCLTQCEDGEVRGIRLRNQASWGLHLLYCKNIDLDSLDIRADHSIKSSDGIDVDSSRGISIRHCYIEDNDDCISIKSGRNSEGRRLHLPSTDILISSCTFGYGHSGVALGSEISGDVSRVRVEHCTALAGNEHFIRFKSQPSRGGVVSDVVFTDCKIDGASHVFDFLMTWRMVGPSEPVAPQRTRLSNILITRLSGSCRSIGRIQGDPDAPLGGITVSDCHLESPDALQVKFAKVDFRNCSGFSVE